MEALSDGVFAIVLTLLVLQFDVPDLPSGHVDSRLSTYRILQARIPRTLGREYSAVFGVHPSEQAVLGALPAYLRSSEAAMPPDVMRQFRISRAKPDGAPIGMRRVPTLNNQVPPNPPTHARSPEETTGTAVSRIGVTAIWHGPHLVGVET